MKRADILLALCKLISDLLNIPSDEIHENSTFQELGLESIDIPTLMVQIENEFQLEEIDDEDMQDMRTVRCIVDYLEVMLRDV